MSAGHTETFDPGASLTSGLVELVSNKAVSESDLRWTALFTLDAIANIIGGSVDSSAQPLLTWARSESLNSGRIAFVYGGLSTVLELDAMHRESAVHAGTVVVPAVLAMLKKKKHGGKRILTTILRGSEVAFRVGRAAGPSHYKIYQNTATCGPYGSAFAVGLLLDLSKSELVHALGNAGTQSSGLWEYRETGAMTKQLHAGRAADAGLIAAQLAANGFTGPLKILEGGRGFFKAACPDAIPAAVLRGPNEPWALNGMSIKPWPSSRHTHPAIESALGVVRDLKKREIIKVDVDTYQSAVDLCGKGGVIDPHRGKSSIQYCVAAALTDGDVSNLSYSDEACARYKSLAQRVSVKAAEPYASAYPKAWGAKVSAHLKDGATLTFSCENVKGDPEAPMSEEEMKAKAKASLESAGIKNPEQFMSAILAMTNDGEMPDITFFP